MKKKYELIDEKIDFFRNTLYRIRALKDFENVKKGELGGFIEKEENLSQEGNCWVYHDALVYDNAMVIGNAKVCGNAKVADDAMVCGNAKVYGNAVLYSKTIVGDNAEICGNVIIDNKAQISGNAMVCGNALVCDHAMVSGNARICDNAIIYGDAKVCGNVIVRDDAKVCCNARICGDAVIKEDQRVETGRCTVNLSKNLKENIRCQTNLIPRKDYVIAYKQVNKDLTSLYDNTFQYKIGEWIEAENPDLSNKACAAGLHFSNPNYWNQVADNDTVYLIAKIMLDDIITVQSGKIRCKRAFIIDRYDIEDN